jgi:hypothetical protein
MLALRSLVLAAVLTTLLTPAARAQAPARDAKTAPTTGTAAIKGRVTGADNGAALRRVRLVLSAPALPRPFYATTDAQGRYEFTDLPAGRYTLTASKNTYVSLQLSAAPSKAASPSKSPLPRSSRRSTSRCRGAP